MKKFLLLGTVLATSILGANAQSSYGTQIGTTYYDLPSNSSVANRVVYNEDDKSVSVTWIQSIANVAQPVTYDRGAGYNHFRPAAGWIHGTEGTCRVNNACSGQYSGWPEIMNFPKEDLVDATGKTFPGVSKEIIIAHSGGLKKRMRYYRSDSVWRPIQKLLFDKDYCAPTSEGFWPRAVSEGNDYIHMIATYQPAGLTGGDPAPCTPYTNLDQPFLYSRSSDQGESWDIQNSVLPGLKDSATFNFKRGGGDGYAIAVNDKYVAILAGGRGEPWVMWKSSNRGLNFDYTVIRDFDSKVYDQKGFFTGGDHARAESDNAHSVVIDNDGTVHCFTGVSTGAIDAVTGEYGGTATFGNSGIWYWNDNFTDFCEPTYIAEVVDYGVLNAQGAFVAHAGGPKYFGDAGYNGFDAMAQSTAAEYYASSTSMPNAAVDAAGNIYVVYSSDVEGTSTETGATAFDDGMPLRDIFLVWSKDKGKTWSQEINVAGQLEGSDDGSGGTSLEEDVYPSVAHFVGTDNILHMVFNMDYKPGSDVQLDGGEFSQQYQTYVGIDVTTLPYVARATVVASPNTIVSIADSSNITGTSFEFDATSGYYGILSPMTVFNETTYDTVKCDTCPSFLLREAVLCNTGAASCGTFYHPDTTNLCSGCAGPLNAFDSLAIVDTFFYKINTILTDLNANGDSIFNLSFDISDQYTFTEVYGNACPDPSTTFTLTNLGGAITSKILGGMDTITICSGTSVNLVGIGGGGTGTFTYKWDGVTSANGMKTVSPTTSTTYIFEVNGSVQDSIRITVNALPTALDAGTDETLTIDCAELEPAASLGGSSTVGMSYSWTPQVGMSAADAITSDPVVLPKKTTTYYVTTTNKTTGCASIDSVKITVDGECIIGNVTESEALEFNISVFPNPVKDVVNVEVGQATIQTITVYNNLGAVVSVINANGKTTKAINTSEYNSGVYYLYVKTSKGDVTKQITVIE